MSAIPERTELDVQERTHFQTAAGNLKILMRFAEAGRLSDRARNPFEAGHPGEV